MFKVKDALKDCLIFEKEVSSLGSRQPNMSGSFMWMHLFYARMNLSICPSAPICPCIHETALALIHLFLQNLLCIMC